MASTAIALIVPGAGGNGHQIANAAATPVVQSPADRNRDHAMTFRVICAVVHDVHVYGFLDAASTTLTDGSELEDNKLTTHAATTGNGYTVTVFGDRAWDGIAVVVTNKSGAAAADIGVDRIVAS